MTVVNKYNHKFPRMHDTKSLGKHSFELMKLISGLEFVLFLGLHLTQNENFCLTLIQRVMVSRPPLFQRCNILPHVKPTDHVPKQSLHHEL